MRFRADPTQVRGSIAPVITPFTAAGELDEAGLRNLVRWQLANGSHGISSGGSTGEPSAQTLAERKRSLEIVAAETADRVPFLPGTGSAKLDETLELTGHARDLGADIALVITPYYARPTQEALFAWYSTVAAEYPDLPIVVYNVPSRTAVSVDPATVARLRRAHDNIVGIKETTKDFEHFSHVLKACGRDFLMWSGIELLCLPLLAIGGVGFVSAVANLAPKAVADMYQAYVDGRVDEAIDLHYRLHPLVELVFTETNPSAVKAVLAERGLIASDHVRPPLIPLTDGGRTRIEALLAEGGDLIPS
ncbi:4-hydroxy-tetrahydrodipicolinate synthase [Saccharopolyspora shandongensis]|uniref:4-hydroxy-tetrahydrodipicolinate synthase n=1 Tax=Saccharopolyspora shandongensis TaxID=418495 RepID=UPI00341B8BD0